MEIIGHQGSQDSVPGNTMEAFAAAIESSVSAIETDVQITKDGEVVIYHDLFLNKKLIKDLMYNELRELPTLSALFTLLAPTKVKINLEIKRDPLHLDCSYPPNEYVHQILQVVEDHHFSKRVYYSSFDPEVLSLLRKKRPNALIAFLYNQESLDVMEKITKRAGLDVALELAESFGAKILSPEYELMTDPKMVKELQKAHFLIHPWTANKEKEWKHCLELGVDGIITDYPHKLKTYLDER